MCDCNDLTPSFTWQETGDCTVEFSGDFTGDPCHDEVGFGWDFDDGIGLLGQNVTYTFPEPGNYVVTLTVASSAGEDFCTQTIEQVIQVTCSPFVDCDCRDFSPEINLTNTSGCGVDLLAIYGGEACVDGVKYTWNMGDGTQLLGSEVSHTYSESGTYTVVLTVSPGEDGEVIKDCVESVELVVEVNCGVTGDCNCETLSPSIQLEDLSDCEVDLAGFHGGDPCLEDITYVWDFGDETGGIGQNVSHEYAEAGVYTVRLHVTASDGQSECTETVTQEIEVTCGSEPCDCAFAPEIEILDISGCSVTFQGVHGGDPCLDNVKYRWDFGDGTVVLGENITHQFDESGTYTVTLTVSFSNADMFCKERTEEIVEVICDECDCAHIDADVELESGAGCTMEATAVINYSCYENMLFVWFIDGSEAGVGETATLNFPGSGTYDLVLAIYGLDENNDICFKEKVELPVEIDCEAPPCDCRRLSPRMEINPITDCEFEFVASQSIACFDEVTFQWYFGDGNSADGQTVSYEYSESGTYTVNLVVRGIRGNQVCEVRLTQVVEAYCPENTGRNKTKSSQALAQFEFNSYPNPSNGLVNLEFQQSEKETLINVYSTTGQLVYEKNISPSSSTELNLTHLGKGVYAIKLVQGTNTAVRYVVLE